MFESDIQWDVDKAAESLNFALFGKSKKKRIAVRTSAQEFTSNKTGVFSSIIHDSDDETFSKKGKKKLKERRRRKNKLDKKSNIAGSPEQSPHHDELDDVQMKSATKKKKQKAKKKLKQKQNSDSPDTSGEALDTTVHGGQKKKQDKQSKTDANSHESAQSDKAKKKRKLSQSVDAGATSSNKKKFDQNKPAENPSITDGTSETAKRKRKRNRKKKNNSKKNKYKHLALNSKVDQSTSESSSDNNVADDSKQVNKKDGQQNKKGSVLSSGPGHFNKDGKTIEKNASLLVLNPSPVKSSAESKQIKNRKKKNQQKSQSSDGVPINLNAQDQSMNEGSKNTLQNKKDKKSQKRKHDQISAEDMLSQTISPEQEKEMQPPKKKKRKKNKILDSSNKVLDSKPQLQVITNSAVETKSMETPHRNALQKTNLKPHVLMKMLNGLQTSKANRAPGQKTSEVESKKKKKSKQKASKEQVTSLAGIEKQSPKQKTGETKPKLEKGKKMDMIAQDHEMMTDLNVTPTENTSSPATASLWGKAAQLGQQAKDKLDSARFRYINEQLYSCQGNEALKMFREDKEAFSVYHQGFENQVNKWPVNPLNVIIKQIKEKPANLVIADFGCGDAKLAASVPQKVHSFDLVALNKRVTACDMSKTQLPSEKVDIAVFCLSLMGTNLGDYIHEACRILKTGGLLKIAEVVSRFSGVSGFIDGVCSHGFQLLNKRDLNQMFYLMDFRKVKTVKKTSTTEIKLKPCIYKRR